MQFVFFGAAARGAALTVFGRRAQAKTRDADKNSHI
jgi:hypothetical protein